MDDKEDTYLVFRMEPRADPFPLSGEAASIKTKEFPFAELDDYA